MADPAPNQTPTASPLFSALAAKYGIGTALQIFSLLNPQGSAVSKGLGASQAAGGVAQGAGSLFESPGLAGLGKGLGTAAGLAGAGYGIYNTATDPNLSTKQKVGGSAVQGGEALSALYGPQAPYVAAFLATQAVGNQMQRSGSPQIRKGGEQIMLPLQPVSGFVNVLSGKSSPRAAANQVLQSWLSPLGLAHKPTTGTIFRDELSRVMNQIPQLKGAKTTSYNEPMGGYGQYDPKAVTAAQQLGSLLAGRTADAAKDMPHYGLQAENILLSNYGNSLPGILAQVLQPQKKAA